MIMNQDSTFLRGFSFIPCFFLMLALNAQKLTHQIDFETGDLSQGTYHECADMTDPCDCAVGTSLVIVKKGEGPVRSGNYALKTRVVDCHERAEMKIDGSLTGNTEWWVGWSLYIPEDYDVKQGGIISQFHDILGGGGRNGRQCDDYSRGGPSLFHFDRETGAMNFPMRHQRDGCDGCVGRKVFKDLYHIDDMRGRWTDFVVNANFSCKEDMGFFKMWIKPQEGKWSKEPVMDYRGSTFPDKGSDEAGPNYRTGLYFGNPGKVGGQTMVLYTDEMKAGKASDGAGFKDVAPK